MQPALVRVVNGAAVLRCLRTIVHAVVADYAGNAEPIVLEDFRPAFGLVFAMQRHIAPCRKRLFIAEKRQRRILPFSVRLSKRSIAINPSMVSRMGLSSAARSRYSCRCSGFGQTSKITAIICVSLAHVRWLTMSPCARMFVPPPG